VTAERRLAKLEGALSPKAATLLWLAEAQQFGSLPAYVNWLIDQPVSAAPLERLPTQARAGVLEAMRGQPRESVREAAHQAVRDAIFLVELVLKINVAAEEAAQLLGLRHVALFWEMRAISAEALIEPNRLPDGTRDGLAGRWTAWRAKVASLIEDIYVAEEARIRLERRCLDGASTLFPDLIADWQRLRDRAERLTRLGDLVGVMAASVERGRHRPRRPQIDLRQIRAAALRRAPKATASLVDAARAATLGVLGDPAGAAMIAELRLRSNCARDSTLA
jgi:hypothetical protein